MSVVDGLLLFWLLPSLVTLQLLIILNRVLYSKEPEDYYGECWSITLGAGFLYPLGLFAITSVVLLVILEKPCTALFNLLAKEIKFKRD